MRRRPHRIDDRLLIELALGRLRDRAFAATGDGLARSLITAAILRLRAVDDGHRSRKPRAVTRGSRRAQSGNRAA